ncbi:MAG TPA: C2H2-type zinc finger protein [Anaerolineales bacterium]|nr:C2H2-type zinc finger protein [Anaerolineales bacterium]
MANDQFRCEECGAMFNSAEEREMHNRTAHSMYTCEDCGQTFESENELVSHSRVAHPERRGMPRR